MIIDAHVHLYPPEVASDPAAWATAAGETHWATLATRRRRDGRPVQTFPSVDELLRVMDEAGVDRAVLLGWYWEKPATCAAQNRFYATCVRAHADRLSAFATVHPGAGGAATLEMMRRARGDGLIGLGELSPHSQGFGVDDPVFADVIALAGELGWPVNLHVTDPASRPYPGRVETPLVDFLTLARTYPKTTFILAHWGGRPSRAEDRSALAGLENVHYDTAASPLIYGSAVWPDALRACGAGRVLFGSDYPLNLYPQAEVAPALARFVAEARAGGADTGVMGRNAASLLRL
ncbi:amidohydrolase family protein [Horticoccus sp. 23ND18S-11]|uniref:amidohydrolase family protein n=1 Tax=Horticoccus sp. 23ND18S-11 TaxID=3391832 RepID=UPI0039C90FCE